MAPKQPCAKYQYVVTSQGPKILPVPEAHSKDEESPADYNAGGYLQVKVRDTFKDSRYTVLRKLGTNRHSALKVVKSAGRYAETARDEIKLLRQVMAANPIHPGRDHVVSFLDSFNHSPTTQSLAAFAGSDPHTQLTSNVKALSSSPSSSSSADVHICIVFEPLGENLLALIARHKQTGVPPALVKVITKQVLMGLQYLHEECQLVHTDIKPENIMISIPDVETHIQQELTSSPSPTSRNVGVPPKQGTRASVAIPARTIPYSLNTSGLAHTPSPTKAKPIEKHVQIFDSKPLLSPSSSASWTSRSLFAGLAKMRDEPGVDSLKAVGTKGKGKGKTIAVDTVLGKQTSSDSSEDSDLSSGPSSIAVSSSVATSCTPPTSIGSVSGAFEKVSMMSPVDGKGKGKSSNLTQVQLEGEDESGRCTCGDEAIMGQSEATSTTTVNGDSRSEDGHNHTHKSNLPISGPSLLSQTAPLDLHPHRPHCSTHSNRNADVSPSPSAPLSQSPVVEPLSTSPSASPTPMPTSTAPLLSVKIADLGNATPLHKHYTEEIQTRQYRSPEAILGRSDWGATADVWSLACVVFELLTAEYLFDPQSQGELFGKDDDHCAQIIELLGKWPSEVVWGGRYSREIFDGSGNLRYIRNLKPWPFKRVMVEKYSWSETDADALCEFLLPMLNIDHRSRARACDMLNHRWLEVDVEAELKQLEG
ncbi:hypothetical protein PHLCEN_2v1064 [Hermanssonia centrifuga]|uniref:non-specific serine/threonine protein kinase n=1 Tax=Hermanssonia centrifuga TaxID=98765 RepID=A0A2R6S487_9APHY|nr:hypothetical protein PHLCEN_2v1064 [Hermanssonia centrifuga]